MSILLSPYVGRCSLAAELEQDQRTGGVKSRFGANSQVYAVYAHESLLQPKAYMNTQTSYSAQIRERTNIVNASSKSSTHDQLGEYCSCHPAPQFFHGPPI